MYWLFEDFGDFFVGGGGDCFDCFVGFVECDFFLVVVFDEDYLFDVYGIVFVFFLFFCFDM